MWENYKHGSARGLITRRKYQVMKSTIQWKKIPLVGSPPATVGGALLGEFDMAITWGGLGADGQFTDKGFVFFP